MNTKMHIPELTNFTVIKMIGTRRYTATVMGKVKVIKENAVGPINAIDARRIVAKEVLRVLEDPHFWFYDEWTPSKQKRTDKAVDDIIDRVKRWSKWEDIP